MIPHAEIARVSRKANGLHRLQEEDNRFYVASHGNLYNNCLQILRNRGYSLRLTATIDADGSIIVESENWYAERKDCRLVAGNPIELLGMAGLYEYVNPVENKPYWWTVEGPNIWNEVLDQAILYSSTDSDEDEED